MISRRKMLGWLGALPLIGLPFKAVAAESEMVHVKLTRRKLEDRIFRNQTVRLAEGFNVNQCYFYNCRIVTQDAFHMSACPVKGKSTVNYGSTAELRPSAFFHSTFTDCIVGAE